MKKLAKAMYGKSMMKKGGASKMKKYAPGGIVGDDPKKKDTPEFNTPVTKSEVETSKKTYKNPVMARVASYFTGKKEYQKNQNPVTGMDVTRTYKDGKKERVIKTKASEETGQRPMQKKGGSTRIKKYAEGGPTLGPVYSGPTGGRGGAGTYEPPVIGKEKSTRKPTSTGKPIKKIGGATKPKAMYGMTAKPSMMRKGGAKKK
jgi:hypothetical protein